jgi:hypothetical protein
MTSIHSHFLGLVMKSIHEQHCENERQWRLWELTSEPSQMPHSTYSGTALVSPRAICEPVLLQNSRKKLLVLP